MKLIPDTIDFSAYERSTAFAATVKPAKAFADRVAATFTRSDASLPSMFSCKLRDRLHFREGECTAWAGYNGHRKSLWTGQVALDLAVQGHRVLLISLEMLPEQTLHRMVRQAHGTNHGINSDVLRRFHEWTDDRLWLFDHVGRINVDHCMAVAQYFADEHRGTQVVIDSVMMVCESEEHLDQQKQFATDCVRIAQETRMHVHVVAHCRKPEGGKEDRPPSKYDLRGSAAITDQMHNVCTVWSNRPKIKKQQENDDSLDDEPDAVVSVEKQRNGAWEGRIKLWFDPASMRFCDDRTSQVQPYQFMG